eukprot:5963543-Amphidinium_carterae.1
MQEAHLASICVAADYVADLSGFVEKQEDMVELGLQGVRAYMQNMLATTSRPIHSSPSPSVQVQWDAEDVVLSMSKDTNMGPYLDALMKKIDLSDLGPARLVQYRAGSSAYHSRHHSTPGDIPEERSSRNCQALALWSCTGCHRAKYAGITPYHVLTYLHSSFIFSCGHRLYVGLECLHFSIIPPYPSGVTHNV